MPRKASEYSGLPLNAASDSSRRSVGLAWSILRARDAPVVRPVNHGRATSGSSASSNRVFPARFVADVICKYGVHSNAVITCVCAAQTCHVATRRWYRLEGAEFRRSQFGVQDFCKLPELLPLTTAVSIPR